MFDRQLATLLSRLFKKYPFVTVTGPRQSGKTTLCRSVFPELQYANLEAPNQREFALLDPVGFLAQFKKGAILDEIQKAPELLSYLQVIADENGGNSLFVLTGSEQFQLSQSITQSLAGRTAMLRLLPLSIAELAQDGAKRTINELMFQGGYPRIHAQNIDPYQAYGDYFETYVERDVRQLSEIRNLTAFQRFIRLCAGRAGQLLNLSSLSVDAGISHTTAREWLSVLETSYLVYVLQPFHANIRKRLVKTPKLYFFDVGLLCHLMGIENAEQLVTHPLRGHIFENLVITEVLKSQYNQARRPNLTFFRDNKGLECDLFLQSSQGLVAVEIKSGSTVNRDYFTSLNKIQNLMPEISRSIVVYAGAESQKRTKSDVMTIEGFSTYLTKTRFL